MPQERIDALRTAFDAMVKDPQFLAAAAQLDTPITPKSGAELQKITDEFIGYSDNVLQLARKLSSP